MLQRCKQYSTPALVICSDNIRLHTKQLISIWIEFLLKIWISTWNFKSNQNCVICFAVLFDKSFWIFKKKLSMTEFYQRLQLSLKVSFNTNQKLNQQIVDVQMNTAIDTAKSKMHRLNKHWEKETKSSYPPLNCYRVLTNNLSVLNFKANGTDNDCKYLWKPIIK